MTREGEERSRERRTTGRGEDPRVYEALGRAIKTARTERGIERKELAAATGLSYAYLSDIESGRRRPSSKAIFAIAGALEMNPSDLMLWTEQLTHRIASEESLAEAEPAAPAARAPSPEAPGAVSAPASPSYRRSWFAGRPADVEAVPADRAPRRTGSRSDLQTSDLRGSPRADLERILDDLGPEDLELVLDLAKRLAREHVPPR